MKQLFATMLALLLPFCLGCAQSLPDEPPQIAWQSVADATAAAATSGKKVLVDVYAPWCGWCRKLSTEVHTDPAVRRYMTEHFETARLDGDDQETKHQFMGVTVTGAQLAQSLGVTGFPHTVFLTSQSDAVITRLPGYVDAPEYLRVLQYIGSDAYQNQTFEDFSAQQP